MWIAKSYFSWKLTIKKKNRMLSAAILLSAVGINSLEYTVSFDYLVMKLLNKLLML